MLDVVGRVVVCVGPGVGVDSVDFLIVGLGVTVGVEVGRGLVCPPKSDVPLPGLFWTIADTGLPAAASAPVFNTSMLMKAPAAAIPVPARTFQLGTRNVFFSVTM